MCNESPKISGGPPRKAFRSEAMVVQIWPDRFPWGGVGVTSCGRKKGREAGGAKFFFSESHSKFQEKWTTLWRLRLTKNYM